MYGQLFEPCEDVRNEHCNNKNEEEDCWMRTFVIRTVMIIQIDFIRLFGTLANGKLEDYQYPFYRICGHKYAR